MNANKSVLIYDRLIQFTTHNQNAIIALHTGQMVAKRNSDLLSLANFKRITKLYFSSLSLPFLGNLSVESVMDVSTQSYRTC